MIFNINLLLQIFSQLRTYLDIDAAGFIELGDGLVGMRVRELTGSSTAASSAESSSSSVRASMTAVASTVASIISSVGRVPFPKGLLKSRRCVGRVVHQNLARRGMKLKGLIHG